MQWLMIVIYRVERLPHGHRLTARWRRRMLGPNGMCCPRAIAAAIAELDTDNLPPLRRYPFED